jgi:hypothetical protein
MAFVYALFSRHGGDAGGAALTMSVTLLSSAWPF